MKKCLKCNKLKNNSEFYKNCTRKDGLQAYCKKCELVQIQEYYAKNPTKMVKHKEQNKQYYKSIRGKYLKYKRDARMRDLKFSLKEGEFAAIISQPCYYCGELQENFNGVDRVNNKKGYIKENCVPCCKICNIMKHAQTKEEFIMKCEKIVEKQKAMIQA